MSCYGSLAKSQTKKNAFQAKKFQIFQYLQISLRTTSTKNKTASSKLGYYLQPNNLRDQKEMPIRGFGKH